MHSIHVQQRKYEEKIRIELQRFISHFQPKHVLAGTLTFRGPYKLEKVNQMWTSFIRLLSTHILCYYSLVDFSKRVPHIHYIIAVREDVTQGINLEQVALYHRLNNDTKGRGRLPCEEEALRHHREQAGTNEALTHYRRLVRSIIHKVGFGQVMDLWPLYSEPEAIATYYSQAYANSSKAKRRNPNTRRKKVVFHPRTMPAGIPIKLTEFSLISKGRAKYYTILLRLCEIMHCIPGDPKDLARSLRMNPRHIYYLVNGLQNSIPGDPKRWPAATYHAHLHERYAIPYAEMPGSVDPDMPLEFMINQEPVAARRFTLTPYHRMPVAVNEDPTA